MGSSQTVIRGQVNARRQAIVPVQVVGEAGLLTDVEAMVDTGYSGYLTLDPQLIAALRLPLARSDYIFLGDGSRTDADFHTAVIVWDQVERPITIVAIGGRALLGIALLEGFDLYVAVVPGGEVRVERRP